MQTVKAAISFIFFVFGLDFLKKDRNQHLPILRYLLGSWRSLKEWKMPSCHAGFAVNDKIYHAELDNGAIGDTCDRFYGMTPKYDKKITVAEILMFRFYKPCVGFGIPTFKEDDILKKLDNGKCHDYAAITLYHLSCHKFLTYSVLAHARWMNWCVLALALVGHGLLYFIVSHPSIHIHATTEVVDTFLLGISIFVDILHMLITLVDVFNIIDERLEDNNSTVSTPVFLFRGMWMDSVKLCLQLIIVVAWLNLVPHYVRFYAFSLYLSVCFAIGFVVSIIVDLSSKGCLAVPPPTNQRKK